MRRWTGLKRCVIAGLLVTATVPACAERHERKRLERVEIQQMEEKWRTAQLAEDTSTMDKLLSDQFVGITASGQVVTKIQQLDRMRRRSLDIKRLDISDTKIKISGNVAVVTSLAQIEGTADGAPLRGAFRYIRVYQRVPGGGWKITNFEATHVGRLPGPAPAAPQASSGGPPGAAASYPPAVREVSGSPRPRS